VLKTLPIRIDSWLSQNIYVHPLEALFGAGVQGINYFSREQCLPIKKHFHTIIT
jgi:hypothetical protein